MQRPTRNRREATRNHAVEIESLRNRVAATEVQYRQLYNTVDGLAREIGLSVGCPCTRCGQCHVLVKDRRMFCPRCRDERYL